MNAPSILHETSATLPGYRVPDGVVFGSPTRLTDSWVPDMERMWLPGFDVAAAPFRAWIERGESGPAVSFRPPARAPVARVKLALKRRLESRLPTVSLGDRLVLDVRWMDNSNIAHIFQHAASSLWHAASLLGPALGTPPLIVLRAKEGSLAQRVYRQLGLEVLCTDAKVSGKLLRFEAPSFYHVIAACRPPVALTRGDGATNGHATPAKIFISRRTTRRIENEAEIARFLTSRGFTTVYYEDIPLAEQWLLTRNATDVVAIHGAALGSLIFKRALRAEGDPAVPFRLTEIFPPGFIVNCFRQYAAALGGSWSAARGAIPPEVFRDIQRRDRNLKHAFASFTLHVPALEEALAQHGRTVRPAQEQAEAQLAAR